MTQNTVGTPLDSAGGRSVSKTVNIIAWILQGLLAFAFIAAGAAKLGGVPEMVKNFEAIGLGQWFRYVTGLFEIGGAVALLIPRTRFYGAVWLGAIMFFAIVAHVMRLHSNPAPAVVLLVLCGIVAYLRRP